MDSADSNSFDKLWYCFSNSMSMEQLLEFALTSKVILSYEIDYLNSFHDRLMQGLWKRSSNGCFYKMDDRHEKLAYILLNENYEADFEKSLEKLRNMSFVHKVHDEMSEPSLSSNQNQYIALVDENAIVYENDEMKVCEDNIDIAEILGNPLGSVLTVGTESADTILEQTVECEHGTHTRSENQEPQIEIEGLYPKFGLTGEIDAALEDQTACNWIEDAQFSNAQEVFDKMPQLSFCKVISLKETVAKDDYEHELELNEDINANQDDFLDQKRQMIAKLGALEGPYFWCMVIMCGSWERFFILQSVLSMGSLPSDRFHADEELYDGNLTQNWPHLQVKKALPSTRYRYESVVKPLMLGDFDRFMGLCFSMVLGAEILIAREFEFESDWRAILNFKEVHSWSDLSLSRDYVILGLIMGSNFRDPVKMALTLALSKYWHILTLDSYACHNFVAMKKSIHLAIVQLGLGNDSPRMSMFCSPRTVSGSSWLLLSYTLEDKGDFRGKEDMVNVKSLWSLLHTPLLWSKCIHYHTNTSSFVNCILYLNGKALKEQPKDGDTLLQSFNCMGIQCHKEMASQVKVFDSGWILVNIVASWVTQVENNFKPMPFDPGGICIVLECDRIALIIVNGDSIGLGLKLPSKFSVHFCVQQDSDFTLEYLLVDEKYPCSCSTINLRREVRFDDFDATYKIILLGRRSVDVKRMTNIDFEEVENDSVLALKRIQKHAVDHISISGRALMVTRVNSFGFDPGGVKYELYPSVLYVTILIFCAFKPGGNGDLSGVTGATRAEFVPLKTRQVTLMEATNAIPLILIFDPGGGVVRLKMTNRAPTHQYGGGTRLKGKGNEDHQIYVFDPGGQLMRFVIKAMVTNSQPGVYYAMSCFNFIDYL